MEVLQKPELIRRALEACIEAMEFNLQSLSDALRAATEFSDQPKILAVIHRANVLINALKQLDLVTFPRLSKFLNNFLSADPANFCECLSTSVIFSIVKFAGDQHRSKIAQSALSRRS
jgi:hypothetical protein